MDARKKASNSTTTSTTINVIAIVAPSCCFIWTGELYRLYASLTMDMLSGK
jgi:hypothetical protein